LPIILDFIGLFCIVWKLKIKLQKLATLSFFCAKLYKLTIQNLS
ncbi:unnamed protein product, partial [Arabidopsis halleri]